MRYTTLFLLALIAAVTPTLLNAQGFHRNLPIGHIPVRSSQASADGGLFLLFEQFPDKHLVRLDNAGELVWAKSIPDMCGYVPEPNGGVLLFRPYDGIQPTEDDPTYDSFLLQRLNADGEMVMNRRIQVYNWYGESSEWVEGSAWTPDGQLYLHMNVGFDDKRVMKFDTDLELLWARESGNSNWDPYHLDVLPDGGVMLHQFENSPTNLANVTRLGPDGEQIWHRMLNMGAPALGMDGASIVVDDEGSVLIAFTATSGPFPSYIPWVVVGKMDVDGNMVWRHAYRRADGDQVSSFYHGSWSYNSPGRILPNGNVYFGTKKGFEFTPQGQFVRELICTSPTLAPGFENVSHTFATWPTDDGWMQYGIRQWTDPLFGISVEMPLLGRTPLHLDSTCFWMCNERTDITTEPPPPEIITSVAASLYAALLAFTTEDWPLETLADVTMDLFEDACELPEIVLFQTSVEELDAVATLQLFPNPVVAGQSIQVEADGPLVLEVLDARGRSVISQQHNLQPAMVNTAGWDAGLYLLRATRPNGQVVGMGRVVVQ